MNRDDYIMVKGRLRAAGECGTDLYRLSRLNYTYRTIHTVGHAAMHLPTHLELLKVCCSSLYNMVPELDEGVISKNIAGLLYRNNAPSGGNLVRLAALPGNAEDPADIYIFYEGPLMYTGYCLWHKPAAACPLTYEMPFPALRTSAGAICHDFALGHAKKKGYDRAVSVNYAGKAVSTGEDPLFVIVGKKVFVADARTEVPQSVERLAGILACRQAGLQICEGSLPVEELGSADEMFSFTPQGILPIGKLENRLYPTTIVRGMEEMLGRLGGKEFLLNV